MKKSFRLLLCALALSLLLAVRTEAANHLLSDEITAVIERDGDVQVTEVWTGMFNDRDTTENYITKLSETEIENFTVSMDGAPLEWLDDWDVQASFAEKAGYYGIHYGEDTELCWGITDYGSHSYTVSYTMKGLAHRYRNKSGDYECDGFHIRFFNDGMTTGPTELRLTVSVEGEALSEENASIWSFGFHGRQKIEDGLICVATEKDIDRHGYLTVLAAIEAGTLYDAPWAEKSWEKTYQEALKGSDYSKGLPIKELLRYTPTLLLLLAFLLFQIRMLRRRKRYLADLNYVRDVPLPYSFGESTFYSGAVSRGQACGNFALAGTLELIFSGCIEPMQTGGKNDMELRLKNAPEGDPVLRSLYDLFRLADTDHDGVLAAKEMRHRSFGESIYKLHQNTELETRHKLRQRGLKGAGRPWKQSGEIREAFDRHAGLMQFLKDMTLIDERSSKELPIWHWYLVYGGFFGISDTVEKEFAALRHISPQYEREVRVVTGYSSFYRNSIGRSVSSAVSQHSSSSSSSGGGGGSSGGSSGGGSR